MLENEKKYNYVNQKLERLIKNFYKKVREKNTKFYKNFLKVSGKKMRKVVCKY